MTPTSGSALRVGFDGHLLEFPAHGVRRYVGELFGALAAQQGVEIVALGADPRAALPPGIRKAAGPVRVPANHAVRTVLAMPLLARRAGVHLFHAAAYTAPLAGAPPVVVTVHDVSYARRPEWYPHGAGRLRQAFYRWSVRRARAVITDSEFSRREIAAAYEIDPDRIAVVPLAVGAPFVGPGAASVAPSAPAGGPPFVLHVGDLHRRRNVERALRSVLALRRRCPGQAVQLVCAGQDYGSGAALLDLARSSGDPDAVRLLGRVNESALLDLYRTAAAFVYPSLYEGFGLPLLEAMACGVPVLAMRAASIPEVVGDAGLLLEPDDEAGFTAALEAVLTRPELRAQLREKGLRRAAAFTWERCARATLAVYHGCVTAPAADVAGRHPGEVNGA